MIIQNSVKPIVPEIFDETLEGYMAQSPFSLQYKF